jgi:hypothetical protein
LATPDLVYTTLGFRHFNFFDINSILFDESVRPSIKALKLSTIMLTHFELVNIGRLCLLICDAEGEIKAFLPFFHFLKATLYTNGNEIKKKKNSMRISFKYQAVFAIFYSTKYFFLIYVWVIVSLLVDDWCLQKFSLPFLFTQSNGYLFAPKSIESDLSNQKVFSKNKEFTFLSLCLTLKF